MLLKQGFDDVDNDDVAATIHRKGRRSILFLFLLLVQARQGMRMFGDPNC